MHIVACTQRSVRVDQKFGNHEQADAFDTLGCSGHTGQHQMDDVFSHVVLTPGDENFGAGNLVAAIGLRLGAGAYGGQIAAGLRFGQVHGSGPLAADELFKIHRIKFVGAGRQQRF
ncbi:hypothetical protein GALL_486120 [mine drainage metagenome]|uniref:Uncharacterized protein n=1 Tax=mine drainage metagenome TaxID=410659 RepID=A0A1J5PDS2_9ZZZZ